MRYFCLFLIFCSGALFSLERMPWIKKDLVLYPRFQFIDRERPDSKKCLFFRPAISGSYYPWWADLELNFADTRSNHGFDSFRMTGGYFWSNDIVADPLSILLGVTYTAASKKGLYDISSFHHGRNELEFFISFGKEATRRSSWSFRGWGVSSFGIADRGSPWIRQQLFWEKNFSETTLFRFYVDGLWGTGRKSLEIKHFKGYGPIDHRSVEVGSRISRIFCDGIEAYFEYGRRVYARNFPANCNFFRAEIIYPYSL